MFHVPLPVYQLSGWRHRYHRPYKTRLLEDDRIYLRKINGELSKYFEYNQFYRDNVHDVDFKWGRKLLFSVCLAKLPDLLQFIIIANWTIPILLELLMLSIATIQLFPLRHRFYCKGEGTVHNYILKIKNRIGVILMKLISKFVNLPSRTCLKLSIVF